MMMMNPIPSSAFLSSEFTRNEAWMDEGHAYTAVCPSDANANVSAAGATVLESGKMFGCEMAAGVPVLVLVLVAMMLQVGSSNGYDVANFLREWEEEGERGGREGDETNVRA